MKKLTILLVLVISSLSQAKTIGYQYDYLCDSEDGQFKVEVFTRNGVRTALKIDGVYSNEPYSVSFEPRLGAKNVNLYFIGSPGEDEQYNVCTLTYTNAR